MPPGLHRSFNILRQFNVSQRHPGEFILAMAQTLAGHIICLKEMGGPHVLTNPVDKYNVADGVKQDAISLLALSEAFLKLLALGDVRNQAVSISRAIFFVSGNGTSVRPKPLPCGSTPSA